MKIIDEIKVAGFQNFEQYMRINPIDIRIIDSEIQSKLLHYSKKYKYRFIANNSLFSSSVKEGTKVIFIATNGLNNAKDLLINGKIFQGSGVTCVSEIENWDKIKKESHWSSVILTDSVYLIAAKHFAFGFE